MQKTPVHHRYVFWLLLVGGVFFGFFSGSATVRDIFQTEAFSAHTLKVFSPEIVSNVHEAPECPTDALRWAENEAFRRFRVSSVAPVFITVALVGVLPEWPPISRLHSCSVNGLVRSTATQLPQPQHLAYIHRFYLM